MTDRWPALMPASEAAEYLGYCRSRFERKVAKGEIRFVLPNDPGWRMYRRADLDAYIDSLPSKSAA